VPIVHQFERILRKIAHSPIPIGFIGNCLRNLDLDILSNTGTFVAVAIALQLSGPLEVAFSHVRHAVLVAL
jgi:hypothetical protein